jgi:hypothetical protein
MHRLRPKLRSPPLLIFGLVPSRHAVEFALLVLFTLGVPSAGLAQPTISSFSPTSGPIGIAVSVVGTNLVNPSSVTFNGVAGTITAVGQFGDNLNAQVPSGATTGPISVTTPEGTATSATDFVVTAISSFDPSSGPIGITVSIHGTNLVNPSSVTFNGVAGTITAVGQYGDNLNAQVPTGATTGPISITTPEGTATSATDFMVTAASTCGSAPQAGCQPAASQKAVLQLGAERLSWRWTSSAVVAPADFGSPPTTTDYTLCLYDARGRQLSAQPSADRTCAGRPCWNVLGTKGFKYGNKAGTPDGLTGILLKACHIGKGKVRVKGGGSNLPTPTLPLTTPVRVQLTRGSASTCWEATYSTSITNTAGGFKAKSD